jgi:hypothetical protein
MTLSYHIHQLNTAQEFKIPESLSKEESRLFTNEKFSEKKVFSCREEQEERRSVYTSRIMVI